jgi:hypothetical protein
VDFLHPLSGRHLPERARRVADIANRAQDLFPAREATEKQERAGFLALRADFLHFLSLSWELFVKDLSGFTLTRIRHAW